MSAINRTAAAGMIVLTLALAWTSIELQRVAADGAAPWTREWITGWLIGPAVSLLVLAVFGTRVHLLTRGQPIHWPKLVWVERGFLLTMALVCGWPYVPAVADSFSVGEPAAHLLAPVVGVVVVTVLPTLLTKQQAGGGLSGSGAA
ncbi:hypothetical protein AB0C33_44755 [Nonomuraea sp. NPDC048881]|uniref:hypothetical protein n=1 Tax=Nonomuraea sp. NPDC048881 TaxID=3155030 RepID=UPI0033CB5890